MLLSADPKPRRVRARGARLRRSPPPGFTVTDREDTWTESQPADRWLDLIFTYSAHSTLSEDRRVALRSALAEVIGDSDVELDGVPLLAIIARR